MEAKDFIEEYKEHGPQIISKDGDEIMTILSINGLCVSYVNYSGIYVGCGIKDLIRDGWTWLDRTPILKEKEE